MGCETKRDKTANKTAQGQESVCTVEQECGRDRKRASNYSDGFESAQAGNRKLAGMLKRMQKEKVSEKRNQALAYKRFLAMLGPVSRKVGINAKKEEQFM